ncbi:DJ-1/PfpI family protein [Terrabacter sp. Ter38]|uniref:DJ-1/PfpI family protein n=1 Tax=Terrabacter sp. Ter38 TaxID=2926030 RepID=UPI0021186CC0|nr:DJ-1/PfpI family protein [Terrabacter sp. Ter38]
MPTFARRTVTVAASAALALLTLAALALAGARVTLTAADAPATTHRSTTGERTEPTPTPQPAPKDGYVVAVVLGATGTVGSDALAPYEVFASSPKFTVYTVAATPGPAPTQGGPDIVPTYTFADTTSGRASPRSTGTVAPGPRPDVVVVPAVNQPDSSQEAPLRAWVTAQAKDGALILGVCYGSGVLAETNLLHGRTATSHWSRITQLTKTHPDVNWVRGQRYVQDGPIITTAGVTSGIPAALHVITDLAGPTEAARVGGLVGYPNWSLNAPTDIPIQSFTTRDLPIAFNALAPWGRPTVGLTLTDGVGEIDLASAFEVYDVSYAARAVPVSATGTITTKHGLVVRTNTLADTPTPTRLAVPGATTSALDATIHAWATRHHVTIDAVHATAPGFDGALEYLASQAGQATAVSAAKMIDYPAAHLPLDGHAGTRVPALVSLGVALTAAAGAAPTLLRRARNRHLTSPTGN